MRLGRGSGHQFTKAPRVMRMVVLLMLSIMLPGACYRAEGSFRYLALGDSYTVGEGVLSTETWPVQLSVMLRQGGVDVGFPEIIAKTGWTTEELLNAIDVQRPRGPFDLVTLLIGVNDQYRGQAVDRYRREFRQLLELAIGLAGSQPSRVLVLSIPDWGVTPFAAHQDPREISREIDLFNGVNREEAAALGVRYANVTTISRKAASDLSMLASDGLHPSGAMYRLWAHALLPTVHDVLPQNLPKPTQY